MQDIIGYYDLKGIYLGKKTPPRMKNYILVMATLRKKICENAETSPYHIPVNAQSRDFCDKKRLLLRALLFTDGRLKCKVDRYKMGPRTPKNVKEYDTLRRALDKIASDVRLNGKRMRYTCGKLKVPINNKYILF